MLNENIKFPKVTIIAENKKNLGEFFIKDALALAKEKELDLYCVSTKVKPPICKIGDFSKYWYEKQKKEKIKNKNKKLQKLKQIRIKGNIALNDIKIKAKKINLFLEHGNKVKIFMRLYGRQLENQQEFLDKIRVLLSFVNDIDQEEYFNNIKKHKNNFEVILSAKRDKNEN